MDSAAAFRVEPAAAADRDEVVELFAEDLRDLGMAVHLGDLGAVFDEMMSEPRAIVLVVRAVLDVERPWRAVGVLVATRLLSVKAAGRALWIEELYVGRRWRRHGLGRMLVESLLERAGPMGIKAIDLEAYQGNAPAAVLYRSLGFRRLGRERFHYRLDWDQDSAEESA